MENSIKTVAIKLAILFSDESNIPSRYKIKNKDSEKKQKYNHDSSIEIKFQKEIKEWEENIYTMLSKIDNDIAWRFLNIKPKSEDNIRRVADCKDFSLINDYLVLRRDIENCSSNEIGRLAMLSVAFQREIENVINSKTNLSYSSNNSNNSNIDFISIDFETATKDRHSPCEIGLTFVKKGEIIESKSWLIKPFSFPYFDSFNMYIHGIKPEDVFDKPEFPEIWNEIKPLIENQLLIAHNAGFDISVLRKTLDYYKIPYPNIKYLCSYIISKKVWKGLNAYDLKSLCIINQINFKHHRAGDDSRACAELSLIAFKKADINFIEEIPFKIDITIGELFPERYKPSESKRDYSSKIPVIGNKEKQNPESIFYLKNIVFTGTLSSMTRIEAQQLIADIGGNNGKSISNDTDFLIVGQQDYRIVGEDGLSSKQEKAIKLIEKGSKIEIISEEAFLKNI